MPANLPSDIQFVTIADLVERWGIGPSKIHRMLEDHQLAAVRIDGALRIPADLVGEEGPISSVRGTLLQLLDSGYGEDEAIAWLFAENDELGESPISALRAGRKSAVRRATQALAF